MNNDLISREALKKAICDKGIKAICEKGIKGYEDYNKGLATALDLIDNAPTIIWCSQTPDGLPFMDLREKPQVVLFSKNMTAEEKQKRLDEFKAAMDNAKFTIEPERPQGAWIATPLGDYVCNKCSWVVGKFERNFCPNCGAEMKGGAEMYREETCENKSHCYDYEHWHCVGCNGCKKGGAE